MSLDVIAVSMSTLPSEKHPISETPAASSEPDGWAALNDLPCRAAFRVEDISFATPELKLPRKRVFSPSKNRVFSCMRCHDAVKGMGNPLRHAIH